jgi:cleavage and polyadenylation specificity factor subunit 3
MPVRMHFRVVWPCLQPCPGVHPAHSGMASLPFVDELDWSTVDAILVTQYDDLKFLFSCASENYNSFHVDHAASLTYIMEKASLTVAATH